MIEIINQFNIEGEIKSYERLVEALSSFAGTCAMKLRLEKSCCSNISVFILTNPHNSNIEQRHSYLTLQFTLEIKLNLFVQTSGQTRR